MPPFASVLHLGQGTAEQESSSAFTSCPDVPRPRILALVALGKVHVAGASSLSSTVQGGVLRFSSAVFCGRPDSLRINVVILRGVLRFSLRRSRR